MTAKHPTPEQRDERVSLPLDEETALRALLKVDPDALPATPPEEPANGQARRDHGEPRSDRLG